MKTITASPSNLQDRLDTIEKGTVVKLQNGIYKRQVCLFEKSGTQKEPIILQGSDGVVFDGGVTFDKYEPIATAMAWNASGYPGLYDIAKESFIRIQNCNWIKIEGIKFRQFWPTIIYFDNSTNLEFSNLDMRDGTFAV